MAPSPQLLGAGHAASGAGDAAGIPVAEPWPAAPSSATPEQQLTQALACFQAEVSAISCADLAAVVHAARPAFRQGIGWSAHLREQQGRSRLQVTVMHTAGAELCSETWADEASDLAGSTGLMLAMLLGIPVSAEARTPEPESSEKAQPEREQPGETTDQALVSEMVDQEAPQESGPADSVAAPLDPALQPLSEEEIGAYHRQVLSLPQEVRRQLTTAFREHFQVPRSARSIGDRITQRQHGDFIARFLEEAQAEPAAAAGP